MSDYAVEGKEEDKPAEEAAKETVGGVEKADEKATTESVEGVGEVAEKTIEKAGTGIHAAHRSKPKAKTKTQSAEKKGSHRVKKSDGKGGRKLSLSSARQSRAWLAVSAVLLVLGLAWVVTYCLTRVYPIMGIGLWNVYIPSVIAVLGFAGVLSWN